MRSWRVRRASVRDAEAIGRVHAASAARAYGPLLPPAALARFTPAERIPRWARILAAEGPGEQTLVALEDGAVLGFCSVMTRSRDPDAGPGIGDVAALYVDPAHAGRGVGSALLATGLAILRAAGCHTAHLWVVAGNRRALGFYAGHGFAADGGTRPRAGALHGPDVRLTRRLDDASDGGDEEGGDERDGGAAGTPR
jgi:ribosomal protein S18 acetylase RimI-like enzyme